MDLEGLGDLANRSSFFDQPSHQFGLLSSELTRASEADSPGFRRVATGRGAFADEIPFELGDAGEHRHLAEFERDLLRERVRSGIAAARERGVVFGRRPGQRIKADRFAPKVLKLVGEGQSYREISHRLGLSKNTVLDIVKRDRVKTPARSPAGRGSRNQTG